MTWLWVLIGVSVLLLGFFVSSFAFSVRWKSIFHEALSKFLSIKENNPEEDFQYWYYLTIEEKYPIVVSGRLAKLYRRKKQLLFFSTSLTNRDNTRALRTLLEKTNLASLILFCVVVENWSLVGKDLKLHYLYSKIETMLLRLELEKYL